MNDAARSGTTVRVPMSDPQGCPTRRSRPARRTGRGRIGGGLRHIAVTGAGLALALGLIAPAGTIADDGLREPNVDAPERSEIRYWDSVIDRLTQSATDGPLTEAQRKSYLRIDTDQLDAATPRTLRPPRARLSTERNGIGRPPR